MTLRAIASGETVQLQVGPAELDVMQLEQFHHDENYHREIARLSVQDRLRHMALHFAKYAGVLAGSRGDAAILQRIATDVLIIAVSSANVLNLRLNEALHAPVGALEETEFFTQLVANTGRMAAACEKLDHLEAYPFREEVTAAVIDIVRIALGLGCNHGWNMRELVRNRLAAVKKKSIFHGRV